MGQKIGSAKLSNKQHAVPKKLINIRPKNAFLEWPTLLVALFCYTGIVGALFYCNVIGVGWALLLLSVSLALHSSLQHEVLHGHPFKRQWLCDLLVFPAVGLFIPYQRFRDLHLRHHYNPNLTDPYDDPESNYLDPATWNGTPMALKIGLRFNNILLGRMLIGPIIRLAALYKDDVNAIISRDMIVTRAYLLHIAGLLLVGLAFASLSTMPIWAYVAGAYFAMSLLKIRTFLEHRAHEKHPGRTVIIEDRSALAFLFLNNNYHAVHHTYPKMPWYRLPALYAEQKAQFLKRNHGYRYASYLEVFRRYFLKSKDQVSHPLMNEAVNIGEASLWENQPSVRQGFNGENGRDHQVIG